MICMTSVNLFGRNSGEIREILEFLALAFSREKISSRPSGISLEFQDVELEFHKNFTTRFESSEIPVKRD